MSDNVSLTAAKRLATARVAAILPLHQHPTPRYACACATLSLRFRYGTHFVSGVGHRGAFVGTITVKLQDMKLAAGASASFKVGYGKVSGMAELKAQMQDSLKTSDVVVSNSSCINVRCCPGVLAERRAPY